MRKNGLYLRLSIADGDLGKDNKDESNSIDNQRTLLVNFVQDRDDLSDEYIEYVDDGYSGTNFERPAFKRMIEDAKTGKIDTIIVKDFSRFGRDYIGVGDYLEQVLPILEIRFISLNNNYDSNDYLGKTMGMDMAIHNLVNNLYSKDISKKLKSALRVKWKNGQWTGGKPPFGYLRDSKTGEWLIDPVAGKYVRTIFDKAIEGCSTSQISYYMNEQNTYSDDENVLKEDDLKNVEGIQSSISEMNELGSNESEGNELLMHSANMYENSEDKYKDNLSSAITFFVCGAAGIIILILNDLGILKFVVKGSSNFILINIVLGLLFVGFIAIGFWSLKYSKNIKNKAAIENKDTDTILAWLNENVSRDDIESSYNNDIAEEMKYFNRSDYIKSAILKQFPETEDNLADTVADKYIDTLFE